MHSGLNHGFQWRDTLVSGWEETARQTGCLAVIIQSHKKNGWAPVHKRGEAEYDGVALRMGYDPMPNKNWIKYLLSYSALPRHNSRHSYIAAQTVEYVLCKHNH